MKMGRLGILILLFRLVCISLAIYMTVKQSQNFLQNKDASSINFRKFHRTIADIYPTFTICLSDLNGKGNIFKPILNKREYRNYFTGSESSVLKPVQDFDKATVNVIEDMVYEFEFSPYRTMKDHSPFKRQWTSGKDNLSSLSMFFSYQDPERLCITRHTDFIHNLHRYQDNIYLTKKHEFDNSTIEFYFHYPRQLIRTLGKPTWTIEATSNASAKFSIIAVQVLRKRWDSRIPCDPNLKADDLKWMDAVINRVKCVPPFWKRFLDTSSPEMAICDTPTKFKEIYRHIPAPARRQHFTNDYESAYETYVQPCTKMNLVFNADSQTETRENKPLGRYVQIDYLTDEYQEIENYQSFGFESLWSGVGGFCGIFLGVSLMQVPQVLSGILSFVKRFNSNRALTSNIEQKRNFAFRRFSLKGIREQENTVCFEFLV